jgi:hypothetical protein
MDTDKIFNLFKSSGEEETYNELEQYKQHPLYFIGMFTKLINNYYALSKSLIPFFKFIDEELQPEDVNKAGEFIILNKAYENICNIDVNNKQHQEALFLKVNDSGLKDNLKLSIGYFEKFEEYEKCKVLKEILDFLNLF